MTKRRKKKRHGQTAHLDEPTPLAAKASGLPLTVPLGIPTYWTPEEALAVFELIDDLRERIWAHLSEADSK